MEGRISLRLPQVALIRPTSNNHVKPIKVKIARKILEEFKTAAKDVWPVEEYGILLGHFDEGSGFHVTALILPEDRGRFCSEFGVLIQSTWHRNARRYARKSGLVVLGDIHSHPSGELGPSECDIDQQTASSYQIFGICGLTETKRGLRARVRFWPSLNYVKTKVTE